MLKCKNCEETHICKKCSIRGKDCVLCKKESGCHMCMESCNDCNRSYHKKCMIEEIVCKCKTEDNKEFDLMKSRQKTIKNLI